MDVIDVGELPGEPLEKLSSCLIKEWGHENPMDLVWDAGPERFAKVFDLMMGKAAVGYRGHGGCPATGLDPSHPSNKIIRFPQSTKRMVARSLCFLMIWAM